MKRIAILLIILCLGMLAQAQTDLYQRYAARTDIRVARVSQFTLDTGITADVTLLEALEDESWAWLCQEFGLAQLSADQVQQMDNGWDVAMFAQRSRLDPTKPAPIINEQVDLANSCYVGVSYLSRSIYIFCCNSEQQSGVIVNYLIEKMRRASMR